MPSKNVSGKCDSYFRETKLLTKIALFSVLKAEKTENKTKAYGKGVSIFRPEGS